MVSPQQVAISRLSNLANSRKATNANARFRIQINWAVRQISLQVRRHSSILRLIPHDSVHVYPTRRFICSGLRDDG